MSSVGALIFIGVTSAIIAYIMHRLMENKKIEKILEHPIKFTFRLSYITTAIFFIGITFAGLCIVGLIMIAVGLD